MIALLAWKRRHRPRTRWFFGIHIVLPSSIGPPDRCAEIYPDAIGCWGWLSETLPQPVVGLGSWSDPNLPIIALANHCPVAPDLRRTEIFALNRRAPCSGCPFLFAFRSNNVRGILVERGDKIAEMLILEPVCPKFLDSLLTESRSALLY
jgi:hypothetical protein